MAPDIAPKAALPARSSAAAGAGPNAISATIDIASNRPMTALPFAAKGEAAIKATP
jgi:hypothetical protein